MYIAFVVGLVILLLAVIRAEIRVSRIKRAEEKKFREWQSSEIESLSRAYQNGLVAGKRLAGAAQDKEFTIVAQRSWQDGWKARDGESG